MEDAIKNIREELDKIKSISEFEEKKKSLFFELDRIEKERHILNFKYERLVKDKNVISSLLKRTTEDLKEVLKELETRAEELSTLLSAIPAFVYFKDKDMKYKMVNKALETFVNLPIEDIIGKMISDVLPEYDSMKYIEFEKEVLKTGNPKYNVEETITKNDKTLYLNNNLAPFRDNKGKVIGLVGISWEITDRKHYEFELWKAKEFA